jgi:hypothetical protein
MAKPLTKTIAGSVPTSSGRSGTSTSGTFVSSAGCRIDGVQAALGERWHRTAAAWRL